MIAGKLAWAFATVAIGTQISYPLTTGATRDRVTVAVVLLLAAAAALHALATRGPRFTAVLLATTAGAGLLVEMVGTATGVPFGAYIYAEGRLGPALGHVPLIIGLAWTSGAYPAWCAAERVASGRRALRLLLATVGLVGWDLYLDAQMVADGQWRWAGGASGLPGLPTVPLSNYLGWLLVAVLMMAVLDGVARRRSPSGSGDGLPVTLYLWTWLGSAVAHAVFLGLPASAGYGFVVMGVLGVSLLWGPAHDAGCCQSALEATFRRSRASAITR